MSLPSIQQQALLAPSEELEQFNLIMKPYLKQLSSMKYALSAQLKELQDSRAYFALGEERNKILLKHIKVVTNVELPSQDFLAMQLMKILR